MMTLTVYKTVYEKGAWNDPFGNPQWGYTVKESRTIKVTGKTTHNNGYEVYTTDLAIDQDGNEYVKVIPIDYHGGSYWYGDNGFWRPYYKHNSWYKNGKPFLIWKDAQC